MAQQTHGAHMGGPRGAAGMMPGEKAKNFKGTMAKPVSYTHLDVYKRQTQISLYMWAAASAATR